MTPLTPKEQNTLARFILEHAPDYDWDLAKREGDWSQDEEDALNSAYVKLKEES